MLPRLYFLQVSCSVSNLLLCSSSSCDIDGGGLGVVDVVDDVDNVDFLDPGLGEYLGTLLSMYLITF